MSADHIRRRLAEVVRPYVGEDEFPDDYARQIAAALEQTVRDLIADELADLHHWIAVAVAEWRRGGPDADFRGPVIASEVAARLVALRARNEGTT